MPSPRIFSSCMEPVQDASGKVRKSVVLSAIAYKNKDVRKANTVTWTEKQVSLDMATRSCIPDSQSPMAIKSDVSLLPQRSQRNSAPCFIRNNVSAGCSALNVETPDRESNAEKPCLNWTSNTLPIGEISQKSVPFSSQNDHLGNRASVGNAGLVCITSNELENLFKLSTLQSHIPIALVPASEFSAYMSRASGTATTPNLHTNGDMKRKMTPDDSAKVGLRNTDRTEGDRVGPSIPYCPPVEPPVFKDVKNDENQKNVDDDVASRMQSVTLELRQRLSRMQLTGESGLRTTRSQKCAIEKSDRLGKQSTNEEISQWLRIHNFDPRVISSLKDFNGMDLYTMDRCQLAKYVGSDRCDEVFHAFRSNCKS
ncbi:unnamed protein product [Calicophoron daubneyi]|uniref:SAM domain-containing protein n=1 Tax=Calicophoron daubneyi TaxID=300641 RepID=A0AAV2TMM4_CALDB